MTGGQSPGILTKNIDKFWGINQHAAEHTQPIRPFDPASTAVLDLHLLLSCAG